MIVVDIREKKLIKELEKRKVSFEIQVLPVGDMVSGDTVIERKEINDFFGSMGPHLTNQYMEMEQYPQRFLIIEGYFEKLNPFEKVKIPNFSGMLARLARQNITVIHVKDIPTFITVSLSIFNKTKKLPSDFRIIKRKKEYVQEILRASAPRIKQKDIEALLKQFGSPLGVAFATQEELKAIKGIGPKIAERIYKNFRNIKNV
jgi:ERCC4-type nuclease